MATEERLPPACAFAISVLAEYDLEPDAVPEEAVEAAQQHMATCERCTKAARVPARSAPRKKKKVRRMAEGTTGSQPTLQSLLEETTPLSTDPEQEAVDPYRPRTETYSASSTAARSPAQLPAPLPTHEEPEVTIMADGALDCQQCRQLLPEYAEALDRGQNVAALYPEVQEHLLTCESGCLVLLDFFRQEAKATRKFRRRPVRNPFGVIGWELTGFFRSGQVPVSPKALAYGTLLLLLLVAALAGLLGFALDEGRYHTARGSVPTPDGIGLSDGLKIFDACNSSSYQYKRTAADALQSFNTGKADDALKSAVNAVQSDTTGCNGAEAAIYRENLHVRQSGRPFGVVLVSFDSGPGSADPQGGTDRHILYGAYTQELVGAYIGQQQYNSAQMRTPGAPLLYLVLANTTGVEAGAMQIANNVSTLASGSGYQQFGLLLHDSHPFLAVLGLGPSSLLQVTLPTLCRAGVPLIAPTSTGLFIIDMLSQTSLYRHCAPGFGFVRFSPDDAAQSALGANYAYNKLNVRNAAVFYDPSNPSSKGSAQSFIDNFSKYSDAHIVARETAVSSGLLEDGRPQTSREDLQTELNDALQVKPRPDLIFAPLLTNDVTSLGQDIARLPQNQQPTLLIGGEFVQPAALQSLVQWGRQKQLTLPHIYVSLSSAARQPDGEEWQKQFYSSFCTSFATPGSFCSGAAALDQGALLFGDGIELIARGIGTITDGSGFPSRKQLVQHISAEKFNGVSCPIVLRVQNNAVTSTTVQPVILSVQEDGSIQIVK